MITRPQIRAFSLISALCLLLLVTGCGSSDDSVEVSPATEASIQKYQAYLNENAESLGEWVAKLRGQIAVGARNKAESRYATARVQYSQIEPVVQSLNEELNKRIDVLPSEVSSPSELTGFHRIEKALFADKNTSKDALETAKKLLADIEELQNELKSADLEPAQITADTSSIVHEVLAAKLDGKEEPYSYLDFVDMSGNIEGAEAAFNAIKPALKEAGEKATIERVEDQFEAVYETMKIYGLAAREPQTRPAAAGARFVSYLGYPGSQPIEELAVPIKALEKSLAEASEQIASD